MFLPTVLHIEEIFRQTDVRTDVNLNSKQFFG